jgi:O-antigen/teichoic acid export membrane protein
MSIAVILFNLILIPLMGIEGAAIASFLAMFLFNLIKYLYVKKRLSFDPFSWDILKIILLGGFTWMILFLSSEVLEKGIFSMVVSLAGLVLFYLVGIFMLNIASDSRKRILRKIKEARS